MFHELIAPSKQPDPLEEDRLDQAFAAAQSSPPRVSSRFLVYFEHEKMETRFDRREREREREREKRAMWPRPVNDCIKANERSHDERKGEEESVRIGRDRRTDERGTHSA